MGGFHWFQCGSSHLPVPVCFGGKTLMTDWLRAKPAVAPLRCIDLLHVQTHTPHMGPYGYEFEELDNPQNKILTCCLPFQHVCSLRVILHQLGKLCQRCVIDLLHGLCYKQALVT